MASFVERASAAIKKRSADQKIIFVNAEMIQFEPPPGETYDLILAIHLFYNTAVADIRSMFFRFITWLKRGGLFFVVSVLPEEYGDQELWCEGKQLNFLGNLFTTCTFGSPEAWRRLVKEFGFEILQEEDDDFTKDFEGEGGGNDHQVCILARKPVTMVQAALRDHGHYPRPSRH